MSSGPTSNVASVASVDVDAVAAAVTSCSSVAHLMGGGIGGQVATYLPGRRVEGVRVTDDALEVHIATRWDVPIPAAAAEVRAALLPLAGGRPVTVAVEDIDEPQAAIPAITGGAPFAMPTSAAASPAVSPTPAVVVGDLSADAGLAGTGPSTPPDAVPSPS